MPDYLWVLPAYALEVFADAGVEDGGGFDMIAVVAEVVGDVGKIREATLQMLRAMDGDDIIFG